MSAVKIVTGVSRPAIIVLDHMPVAVILAIVLTKMESLVMVHKKMLKAHLVDFYASLGIHTDIDECAEGTDECDEYCYNTVGSYSCDCTTAGPGYRLHSDGTTCESKPSSIV